MKKEIYFLGGPKIFLRPIEVEELRKTAAIIEKWVNDETVTYFMFTGQKPKNLKQVMSDLEEQLESKDNVIFLVQDQKTKKSIGYAGLYEINSTAKKAELRILIGEKDFWGKGCGSETVKIITYYGFDRLNLNRIYLGFTADNKGAAKAYEKAGYSYEGTLKEDIYRNSRYYDSLRMAILKKNYYKNFYKSDVEKFKQKI